MIAKQLITGEWDDGASLEEMKKKARKVIISGFSTLVCGLLLLFLFITGILNKMSLQLTLVGYLMPIFGFIILIRGISRYQKANQLINYQIANQKRRSFMTRGNYDEKVQKVRIEEAEFYQKVNKMNVDTTKADEYVENLNKKASSMKFCYSCGEMGKPNGGKCPLCGKKY